MEEPEPEEPLESEAPEADRSRRRMTTAFGWVTGTAIATLINFGLFVLVGPSYPKTVSTFVAITIGAFGGMYAADRMGLRGFKPLGIAAGISVALFLFAVAAVILSPPG